MIKSWPFLLRMGHQLLASGMEVGAFALQFIDYWYSQEAAGGNSSHNIIMETASLQAPKASLSLINKCPLCRTSNIQTPTVLIICGYVFCYRCILEQVQKQKTCPMTGLPAHSGQLIRLFWELLFITERWHQWKDRLWNHQFSRLWDYNWNAGSNRCKRKTDPLGPEKKATLLIAGGVN